MRRGVASGLGIGLLVLVAVLPSSGGHGPGLDVTYQITIDTDPTGLIIAVDGSPFVAPYTFSCPGGSVYSLDTPSPQGDSAVRYVFDQWSDGGAQSHAIVCVTDLALTAFFSTEYFLDISADWGTTNPTSGWFSSGTTVAISWLPPSPSADTRFAFAGWIGSGPGSYTGFANPAVIAMLGPIIERAEATREFRFTFDTSPSGLTIVTDGVNFATPTTFWWAEGSTHDVWCPDVPVGGNHSWTFDHWDDGVTDNPRLFTTQGPENRTCFYTYTLLAVAIPDALGDLVRLSANPVPGGIPIPFPPIAPRDRVVPKPIPSEDLAA